MISTSSSTSNLVLSRGHAYGVKHLLAPFPGPLEDVLLKTLSLSKLQTQFLLDLGAIYLNEKRLAGNGSKDIQKDDYLRVHQKPRRFPISRFNYPACIVYEDGNLLVINKPSGLPVHPTVDNTEENILSLLEKARGEKLYITHRLDTATSGLMIYAKNSQSQSTVNQFLVEGKIKKYYRALVGGIDLKEGEWLHYMEPSPRAPKKVSTAHISGWAECKLNLVDQTPMSHANWGPVSEVMIELITGRTHQIRAQLSSKGFPILGDRAYGSKVSFSEFEEICLQSSFLQMPNPNAPDSFLSLKLETRPWSQLLQK
jgi:23S rRNA pseudouridine1911/1915/1917 synthase